MLDKNDLAEITKMLLTVQKEMNKSAIERKLHSRPFFFLGGRKCGRVSKTAF